LQLRHLETLTIFSFRGTVAPGATKTIIPDFLRSVKNAETLTQWDAPTSTPKQRLQTQTA